MDLQSTMVEYSFALLKFEPWYVSPCSWGDNTKQCSCNFHCSWLELIKVFMDVLYRSFTHTLWFKMACVRVDHTLIASFLTCFV